MIAITGQAAVVADLLREARLPASAEILGPVPAGDEEERMLVRVPRSAGKAAALALKEAAGVRSARREQDFARTQVDPLAGI